MKIQEPDNDWLEKPVCPDCDVELRNYVSYRPCPECGQGFKRRTVEVQFEPL